MDILLFGGTNLLKNFSVDIHKQIICINRPILKEQLDLNDLQLVYLGILLGSDYCDNKTISIKKALNYVRTQKLEFCQDAVDYFLDPPVHNIISIKSEKNINTQLLYDFLKTNKFKTSYIENIYKKIENINA